MEQLFLGLWAGERGLDDYDGSCRHVVLGAQSDDRAASMKNVANELKSCCAHQAIWINAKSNVVNGVPAVDRLGNHELLVFRPSKLSRSLRNVRNRSRGSPRRLQQAPDHSVKGAHARQFRIFLVSSQHRVETVGSGKHDFGNLLAMDAGNLGRKHVFEFVCKFAEFVEAARCGIAFQRMHNATNTSNHFLV